MTPRRTPAPPPTAVSTQPAQPEALAGIGGVVENEAKSPIPGVKIRIGWQENPLTPGARPSYHSKTVTTNAAGQWVLPAVKPASTVSVSLQLTHRDYALQDLFGTSLDKLAAHTFIATLTPGLTVTGQVVDASGNPVAGATITSK